MNDKKHTTLSGSLMFPLYVGCRALIRCEDGCLRTSRVATIHSVDHNAICFETQNTYYRLLPVSKAQTAEYQTVLAMAA